MAKGERDSLKNKAPNNHPELRLRKNQLQVSGPEKRNHSPRNTRNLNKRSTRNITRFNNFLRQSCTKYVYWCRYAIKQSGIACRNAIQIIKHIVQDCLAVKRTSSRSDLVEKTKKPILVAYKRAKRDWLLFLEFLKGGSSESWSLKQKRCFVLGHIFQLNLFAFISIFFGPGLSRFHEF